jgi:hypothetical protein
MRYAGPRMIYRHPILALLHQVAAAALEASGKKIPLEDVVISIRGKIIGRNPS